MPMAGEENAWQRATKDTRGAISSIRFVFATACIAVISALALAIGEYQGLSELALMAIGAGGSTLFVLLGVFLFQLARAPIRQRNEAQALIGEDGDDGFEEALRCVTDELDYVEDRLRHDDWIRAASDSVNGNFLPLPTAAWSEHASVIHRKSSGRDYLTLRNTFNRIDRFNREVRSNFPFAPSGADELQAAISSAREVTGRYRAGRGDS